MTDIKSNNDGFHHITLFGAVPNSLVDTITVEHIESLYQAIWKQTDSLDAAALVKHCNTEDYLKRIDAIRIAVGALYIKVNRDLDKDTKYAHSVIDNYWKSMLLSMFSKKLKPQKYYHLCGPPNNEGYNLMADRLSFFPNGRQDIVQRWSCNSYKDFANSIFRTIHSLRDKEQEYRYAAVTVAQSGIGIGGMLLGFVGLALAIIIPYFSPVSPPPSPKDISNQIILDLSASSLISKITNTHVKSKKPTDKNKLTR
jgi:hypothetical protein